LARYSELVEKEKLPLFRGYIYNDLELMTRDVILGMKLIRFDRNRFRKRHGFDLARLCEPAVRQLQNDEFITVEDDAIVLTRKGILYGDYTGRVLATALESLAN
jgi:oxygen-independent coproporphyrinogen-3 oxidase